jgi:hypothetical protein
MALRTGDWPSRSPFPYSLGLLTIDW